METTRTREFPTTRRWGLGLALAAGLVGGARSAQAQGTAPAADAKVAPAPRQEAAPNDLSVILSRFEQREANAANAAAMPSAGHEDHAPGTVDEAVHPTGCASCGGHGPKVGYGNCGSCGTGRCVPGRGNCDLPYPDSHWAHIFGNLYECLCCPDPCYQPAWIPAANASFFTDFARPRTLSRFRYDRNWNMRFPDRNEYFWARQSLDTNKLVQRNGRPVSGGGRGERFLMNGVGNGPKFPPDNEVIPPVPRPGRNVRGVFGETGLDVDQLYFYQEAASERASAFIEIPYRSMYRDIGRHTAGFGDLNFGIKSLLIDCELMQLTFQFKTYTPTGQSTKGFGTGHVSLEPSLLLALKLAEDTYFQGQIAEWIPLGGDQDFAGAIIKYSGSLNHVLARTSPDSPVIGTLELFGMTFQDGLYTDPYFGPRSSSGGTYLSMGPGLRHSICDRVDYGGSIAWQVTDSGTWGSPLLRLELRILY